MTCQRDQIAVFLVGDLGDRFHNRANGHPHLGLDPNFAKLALLGSKVCFRLLDPLIELASTHIQVGHLWRRDLCSRLNDPKKDHASLESQRYLLYVTQDRFRALRSV
jgi:hypothetical protein